MEIAGAFQAADLALLQAAARGACGLPGGARPWADELGAVLGLGRGLGSVFDLGPLGPMMQHMQEFMREFQALEGEEAGGWPKGGGEVVWAQCGLPLAVCVLHWWCPCAFPLFILV